MIIEVLKQTWLTVCGARWYLITRWKPRTKHVLHFFLTSEKINRPAHPDCLQTMPNEHIKLSICGWEPSQPKTIHVARTSERKEGLVAPANGRQVSAPLNASVNLSTFRLSKPSLFVFYSSMCGVHQFLHGKNKCTSFFFFEIKQMYKLEGTPLLHTSVPSHLLAFALL
jgi:hypothetical protein